MVNEQKLRENLVEMKEIAQSKGERYKECTTGNTCNKPGCKCGGQCPVGVKILLYWNRKLEICQVLERACENLLKKENFRLFVRNTRKIPVEIEQDVLDLIFGSCLIEGRQKITRPINIPDYESHLMEMYGHSFLDAVRELETVRRAPCSEIVNVRTFQNFELFKGFSKEGKDDESVAYLRYLLKNLEKAKFVFKRATERNRDELLWTMCGYRSTEKLESARMVAFQAMLAEEPISLYLETLVDSIASVMENVKMQIRYIQDGSSARKVDYGQPAIDIFLAASGCKFAALKFLEGLETEKFGDFFKKNDPSLFSRANHQIQELILFMTEENIQKEIDEKMKISFRGVPADPDEYLHLLLYNVDDNAKTFNLSRKEKEMEDKTREAVAPYEEYDKVSSSQWNDSS